MDCCVNITWPFKYGNNVRPSNSEIGLSWNMGVKPVWQGTKFPYNWYVVASMNLNRSQDMDMAFFSDGNHQRMIPWAIDESPSLFCIPITLLKQNIIIQQENWTKLNPRATFLFASFLLQFNTHVAFLEFFVVVGIMTNHNSILEWCNPRYGWTIVSKNQFSCSTNTTINHTKMIAGGQQRNIIRLKLTWTMICWSNVAWFLISVPAAWFWSFFKKTLKECNRNNIGALLLQYPTPFCSSCSVSEWH